MIASDKLEMIRQRFAFIEAKLSGGAEARELAAAKKLSADHGLPALARALFNTHEFITIP